MFKPTMSIQYHPSMTTYKHTAYSPNNTPTTPFQEYNSFPQKKRPSAPKPEQTCSNKTNTNKKTIHIFQSDDPNFQLVEMEKNNNKLSVDKGINFQYDSLDVNGDSKKNKQELECKDVQVYQDDREKNIQYVIDRMNKLTTVDDTYKDAMISMAKDRNLTLKILSQEELDDFLLY
jgi:hypothetical protein